MLRSLKTVVRFTEDEIIVILQYSTDDGPGTIAQITARTEADKFPELVGNTVTGCIFQLLEKLKDRPDVTNYPPIPATGMAGAATR